MLRLSSERLATGLMVVALATLAAFSPAQSDTWWLLRAGKDIWQQHAVRLVDQYSYTAHGLFWPNHEWLTELAFFFFYSVGGLPMLTAVCATLVLYAWAVSWRLCRGSFEVRIVVFVIPLSACVAEWALRPQTVSLALFATACALLVKRRHAALPLLFLLWANLHGGVSLGVAALAGATASTIFSTKRVPWRLLLIDVLCFAATCVSPLRLGLWTFIPGSVERLKTTQVLEWQAPGADPKMWGFWALAAALPVLTVYAWRRADDRARTLAGISAALLPLAVTSVRNVPVFLLAAVPAVTSLFDSVSPRARRPMRAREREDVNGVIFLGATAIAIVVVASGWSVRMPVLGWKPIPAEAIAALEDCQGPIYNTFNDGGILIWFVPDRPVFIDNRQDPYPIAFLRESREVELGAPYSGMLNRYGVKCAVVATDVPVTNNLRTDANWRVTYQDERWTVLVRRM